MELLTSITSQINSVVWGVPMLVLILGVGAYLMFGLGFMPLRRIGTAIAMLRKGRKPLEGAEGEISPFNALMTALSATVGTGNIAGVATAIAIGGPGALFWMWCTALVGMATKYAEAFCAVKYREVDENGDHVGGPMYYIKNGLGKKWVWLGTAFAGFGAIAGFGIGNMVQSNSIADVMQSSFSIPPLITGIVLMVLAGAVLLGGIRRIGAVAGVLVPFMAVAYLAVGLIVILANVGDVPAAIALIVKSAFTGTAAAGGFTGAAVLLAIQMGVARGVFSNEAGLGSAAIAHAASQTKNPVRQGMIGMLGTFIDTLIICSITGLAIVMSGMWQVVDPASGAGYTGATLTSMAFGQTLGGFGGIFIAVALGIFAFTTILGWSFYSEKCTEYLFGVKAIKPFRVLWVAAIIIGPLFHAHLNYVWLLADTLNALMAIPNLVALALLSPVIFQGTKAYLAKKAQSV